MDEKKSSKNEKPALNNYIKYSGLGFQMIGIIAVFTFVGYKIDAAQNNQTPYYTAALSLAGVVIALYVVFKGLK